MLVHNSAQGLGLHRQGHPRPRQPSSSSCVQPHPYLPSRPLALPLLRARPRLPSQLHASRREAAGDGELTIEPDRPMGSSSAGSSPSPSPTTPSWLSRLQHLFYSLVRLLTISAVLLLVSLLPRPRAAAAANPDHWATSAPAARCYSRAATFSRMGSISLASSSANRSSSSSSFAAKAAPPAAPQQGRSSGSSSRQPPAAAPPPPQASSSSATPSPAAAAAAAAATAGGPESISSTASGAAALSAPSSAGVPPAVPPAVPPPLESAADPLVDQLGIQPHEAAVIRLFERCRPSVVNIVHTRSMQSFSTLDVHKLPHGQGSGIIWDLKGHVVTNYHLVKGAAEVKVTLSDQSTYTAKVVGSDAAKDVAVLKLTMPKTKLAALQPVVLGKAVDLRVGQAAYAIGNPWALDHSLAKGVISGLNRELSCGLFPIKNTIQVDCAINPGFSGGALFDSQGRLIGIPTAVADVSGKGTYSGTGFAVPICSVKGLIQQILTHGRPMRPALGVTLAPAQVLQQMGIEGVLVLEVPPGSPAHTAGLRPTHRDIFGDIILGDIVVAVDGKPVAHYGALFTVLDGKKVGDRVKVDLLRDGKSSSAMVTLGERVLGLTEE